MSVRNEVDYGRQRQRGRKGFKSSKVSSIWRGEATLQLLPWDGSPSLVTIATVRQFIGLSLCDCPEKNAGVSGVSYFFS